MARKRTTEAAAREVSGITPERFVRLVRLLTLLGEDPRTRAVLIRRLRTHVRGFYRDLELLREYAVTARLQGQHYHLEGNLQPSLMRLPFPDPHLSYGEIQQLARGRSAIHRKLQARIDELTS